MKKKISTKVDNYLIQFKNDIKKWIHENKINITHENNENKLSEFLQYVYDYNSIEFTDNDFQKRKRIKNKVPDCNRCCALKSNGERCSRKVKIDSNTNYCGTHIKGIPYGSTLTNKEENMKEKNKKVEIWIQEVNGISWYIDKDLNVYDVNDIRDGSNDPKIIHKLKMNDKMEYEFCN
tara:strand:- start:36 stop:569 length:534 start_codon:yes stop_codon:yes gene_type:complete